MEREGTAQSYLVRLWCDRAGAPWRAMVTEVADPTGRRQFAGLDDLFAFLLARTEGQALPASGAEPGAEPDA